MENDKPYLIRLKENIDDRGVLTPIEGAKDVPFEIKRVFYIYGLDEDSVRANHANFLSAEVLICLSGACDIELTDRNNSVSRYCLTEKNEGLYIPKMIWRKMSNFKKGSIILAVSDMHYDPDEIIFDKTVFLKQ
ncbi:MAG: FdtA/QdtA family cupin domain-containing protein [Clostridia bacterium]|nr:FdtA/QdtA family cupin domain-containing protein [Clostridia bacterium]